jgi:hypothetical protein
MAPYGGYECSGYGREMGFSVMWEVTQQKNMWLSARYSSEAIIRRNKRIPALNSFLSKDSRRRLYHCACGFTATACSIADRTCAAASSARSRVA